MREETSDATTESRPPDTLAGRPLQGKSLYDLYGAFPVKWSFWFVAVFCSERQGRFSSRRLRSGSRSARRGQGTETVAEVGGLPPSGACVSQRLDV